ncbi:MAG: ACP S-malonyltransferase [Saprospiraceae bacterium]|nr:ACP S-malonyltransferase [Saprospiraceae bacterium]
MKAYVFPGQGAQYPGMGKEWHDQRPESRELFDRANAIMGFDLAEIMFNGTEEDLRQTRVTQPAIFVQSVIPAILLGDDFRPDAVAGHSLGEFSALTAAGALSFEDGLALVRERAMAMQEACERVPGTMAAILGLEDDVVEAACAAVNGVVVPANYNAPGQLVISGTTEAVEAAIERLTAAGAKRAVLLAVGGAFHSPLMEPARQRLATAIQATGFRPPRCPVYQNVTGRPEQDPSAIQANLMAQLTAPVRWTQSIRQMVADGVTEFVESGGKGAVLRGLIRKIEPSATLSAL